MSFVGLAHMIQSKMLDMRTIMEHHILCAKDEPDNYVRELILSLQAEQ